MSEFKKDFIKVSFLKISNLLLKFVSSIVIVRILGIEGRGELFTYTQISGVISFILCLSIGDYFIYNNKKNKNYSLYKFHIYYLIILVISVFFISKFFLFEISYYLLFILSGGLDYLTLSLFKSQRNYNTVNLFIILKTSLFILPLFIFEISINQAIYLYFFISLFLNIVFQYPLINSFKIKLKAKFNDLIKSVNYAKLIHVNNLFTDIENKSDIIIMAIFLDAKSIGVYSVVVVLVQALNHVTNLIIQTIAPLFNKLGKIQFNFLFNYLMIISVVFSLTLILSHKIILDVFYLITSNVASNTLIILSIAIIPDTLSRFLITSYKYGERDKSYLKKISIVTAILNILLNIMIIPIFGIIGAACVSLITYSIRLLCIIFNIYSTNDKQLIKIRSLNELVLNLKKIK